MTTDPKRTNLRATPVRFKDDDGYPPTAEPGAFQFFDGQDVMMLACPGCGHVSGMTVGSPKPPHSPSWEVTGPKDAPTLSPSVHCTGCCGWHGYLTDGVFESC